MCAFNNSLKLKNRIQKEQEDNIISSTNNKIQGYTTCTIKCPTTYVQSIAANFEDSDKDTVDLLEKTTMPLSSKKYEQIADSESTVGVFPGDQIPRRWTGPSTIVANFDEQLQPETHWIALYVGDTCYRLL